MELSLAFSAFLLLIFICLLTWRAAIFRRSHIDTQLTESIQTLDRLLDKAAQKINEIEPRLDSNCDELVTTLRELVAITPDIRSISIVKGPLLLCSSIYGSLASEVSLSKYTKGQLALFPANSVSPRSALLVFRGKKGGYSVLVGIDVQTLVSILTAGNNMYLSVGDTMLDSKGHVHYGSSITQNLVQVKTSNNYAYRIISDVSEKKYLAFMWGQYFIHRLWIAIIGACIGGCIFYYFKSPRRELSRALANQEFIAYIQPIMSSGGNIVIGGEILMRWSHPKYGMISPDDFIHFAEKSGMIVPMTRALMCQVQEKFSPLASALPIGFHFSFNIAASHCENFTLINDCRSFISSFPEKSVQLVLELTERESINVNFVTEQLLLELRSLGVHISIDDFGTGHSNLSYLQQFGVDIIKIDKSFIEKIETDLLSTHIIDNVIDLSRRVGLKLVAEGVENQCQVDYLTQRGVDLLQGYYYGKPVPLDAFYKTVKNTNQLARSDNHLMK